METFQLREEFIRLGQLLKATGISATGVEAKIRITQGDVKVNGETEVRRGRKLYSGDLVTVDGTTVTVKESK